ncbi:MAG TPA: LacI family DNA-binding transcriptional regulator [Terracidiphilus sp.]|jgi:DNA-binding LacI/PurR family transcriptional regulator|nr:LacI family DNA-binding transcriptional regulator [Terracidiphilus sp.]
MKESAGDKKQRDGSQPPAHQTTSLKQLAEYLGLNPATVSVVLNEVPGRSIPQATRDRIKAAAKQMNYQPNLLARSLRSRRTLTIGILVPELGDGYHTQVMSGIGDQLIKAGYFYFTAHHRHKRNLVEEYTRMLIGRGAQGIIAIDTLLEHAIGIPVVAVAGHRHIAGVTNVLLDHVRAAELTLNHLYSLGHRHIAFMRGQPFSSDSRDRWESLVAVAEKLGLEIKPELVVNLERDLSSPELGYPVVQQLLAARQPFTALVAFNDISAIGAIRAFQDVNLRVPDDISVIGFDDINAAAFTLPRLTTINQPLEEIGRIATQALLNRIHNTVAPRDEITVEPELVIRESTGPVKG